jgi:hypothetical protein
MSQPQIVPAHVGIVLNRICLVRIGRQLKRVTRILQKLLCFAHVNDPPGMSFAVGAMRDTPNGCCVWYPTPTVGDQDFLT